MPLLLEQQKDSFFHVFGDQRGLHGEFELSKDNWLNDPSTSLLLYKTLGQASLEGLHLIQGPAASGKTTLACFLAAELTNLGCQVAYLYFDQENIMASVSEIIMAQHNNFIAVYHPQKEDAISKINTVATSSQLVIVDSLSTATNLPEHQMADLLHQMSLRHAVPILATSRETFLGNNFPHVSTNMINDASHYEIISDGKKISHFHVNPITNKITVTKTASFV